MELVHFSSNHTSYEASLYAVFSSLRKLIHITNLLVRKIEKKKTF
jgi:hypothetical protein